MPQASEELRNLWGGEFGVGEDKAEKYLQEHGYILMGNWCWKLPTPNHQITEEERSAIHFLMYEWDYGGIWKEEEE